jgi:hypothetical protein
MRKFTFTWTADSGAWDIGRYRVEATLGYGKDNKQFTQADTYFYVLPLVPLMEVVGGGLTVLLFLAWAIRAYVRRALVLEMSTRTTDPMTPVQHAHPSAVQQLQVSQTPTLELRALMRPITVGLVDLRRIRSAVAPQRTALDGFVEDADSDAALGFGGFFFKYRYFFIFIVVVSVSWIAASAFFSDVLTYERTYTVEVVEDEDL